METRAEAQLLAFVGLIVALRTFDRGSGMLKPLYQPWNDEEFNADLQVRAMTAMERWMYRSLLQAAFFCSTRPYLPDDDGQLWLLAGCESRKQWEKNKKPVRAMFTRVQKNGQRLLSRRRLVDDWSRIIEKRRALAEKGRKGGLARVKRQVSRSLASAKPELSKEVKGSEVKGTEEPGRSDRSSQDTRIGELDTGTRAKRAARMRKSKRSAAVEDLLGGEFWRRYPRKIHREKTAALWATLCEADRMKAIESLAAFTVCGEWTEDGGKFIPGPDKFLADRRWENAPPAVLYPLKKEDGNGEYRGHRRSAAALPPVEGKQYRAPIKLRND